MSLPTIQKPPVRLDFYCDSSSHRGHDYMVTGGVLIRESRYAEISDTISQIKRDARIFSEMKWTNYKGGQRTAAYEALVEYLFLLVEQSQAHFHCIIANFRAFDHRRHAGTPDTSVNRMYFQLGLHRLARFYGKDNTIRMYPDYGNDSRDLVGYRDVLCAHAYRRYETRPNCIPQIQPKDSAAEVILQMVDVVIGGIAAKRNSRNLVPERAALADYILKKSGRPSWDADTPADARNLTVWNFRHQ